ncbi:hypothetical protein EVAR_44195_1 [Eumeta japonica]|uniref:Uncharacterized protein n=1 Tax=Eumeta variegata TaxID=151549 RepID=A0A4C1W3M0_EUMVA|nr:hypothetical protein EVAR_44195_1 [Eumeta japonica]
MQLQSFVRCTVQASYRVFRGTESVVLIYIKLRIDESIAVRFVYFAIRLWWSVAFDLEVASATVSPPTTAGAVTKYVDIFLSEFKIEAEYGVTTWSQEFSAVYRYREILGFSSDLNSFMWCTKSSRTDKQLNATIRRSVSIQLTANRRAQGRVGPSLSRLASLHTDKQIKKLATAQMTSRSRHPWHDAQSARWERCQGRACALSTRVVFALNGFTSSGIYESMRVRRSADGPPYATTRHIASVDLFPSAFLRTEPQNKRAVKNVLRSGAPPCARAGRPNSARQVECIETGSLFLVVVIYSFKGYT